MRQLKGFILRQFERNQLTKEEGFDLLRELAEAELAQAAPAVASPAAVASPVLPVSTAAPALARGTARGDIAVVGLSCRLPKARGPEQLWHNLVNGVDAVTPFPQKRLDDVLRVKQELWQQYRSVVEDPKRDELRGGWLEDVDRFDAPFFDINPVDARTMGPAERLFLETAWEALEGAGYTHEALRGSRTGVYLAHSPEVPFEYARLLPKEDPQAIPFNNPGATGYRLAYWLNLRGPTAVINTTCSSSLAAIHVACQSLRAGDCEMALAGGISVFVFPFFQDTSDPMRLRSPDGRCKAFDASADGLSMGEGLGLVVLKPLEKAEADGDFIHAVIKGSALNSDGRSNGLTAPNPAAQTDVLLRAWENAGISPDTLGYIEAHGAGTNLGDPIEVKGLSDAFRRHTDRKRFCALGSVKTNISHLGDAAGVSGLLKVVLGLRHRTLPPSLHFKKANPLIPFDESPLYVNAELKPWEPVQGVRRAGVSSFGISGTNCHVVLEEYVQKPRVAARAGAPVPCVLPISGRSLGALWRMLARYEAFLAEPGTEPLEALCHAAARFRDHHEYRVAIVGTTRDELRQKVGRLSQLRHLERLPESFAAQGIYAARVGRQGEAYSELPRGTSGPEALVRAYLTEPTVDWARHLPERFDRVPLPTYAFDAIRFWPEHEVREAERFDDFFFDLRWVPKARPEAAPAPRKGVWLLLGDDGPVCRELVERLRAAGSVPVVARADERFAALSATEYLVDPAVGGDYERLVEEVKRAHAQPLVGVVHLWTCQSPDEAMGSLEGITRSQDVSALSMYRLVHGLLKHGVGQDVELFIVSAYTQAVDGSEPATVPARITTFGFSKVLSQESPLVATCAIDVDVAQAEPTVTAGNLFQELCVDRTRRDELVAWRRGQRYTQTLEKMGEQPRLESHQVRAGGVYVIAGGTGYLGIQVGKYLARQAKVKVVLLSRSKLPPRERWAELRRTEAPDSPLVYQLSGIAEMEALGSEVLCVPADVTDPLQLEDAIGRVRKRYGRLNGVMVAMKQLYHKPIAQLTEEEFHTGLMNRVRGTWLLDSLTRQDDLDFFILFSSISSIMGTKTASECCSVNQYLDAYAAYGRSLGRRVSVLNLTLILDDRRDFRGPTPIPPLDFREFLGCFEHFLQRQPPLAVVARFDRDEVDYLLPVLRIPFSDGLLASMGISRAARALQALPAPGEAAAPVAASAGEILETLRGVWKELLGQQPQDDEESFFHAGGTSLTALKLVALVRQKWGVKFEPADAYGHSTLAAMASYIAAQVSPKPAAAQEDTLAKVLEGVEGGELDVEAALSALRSRG